VAEVPCETARKLYNALVAVNNEHFEVMSSELRDEVNEACTAYEECPAVREAVG
jgi:hypothetical protein